MSMARSIRALPHIRLSSIAALIRQVAAPVRWEASVRRLASEGVTAYVEVGPGTVLSGLIKKVARDAMIVNLDQPAGLAAVDGIAGMDDPRPSEHS